MTKPAAPADSTGYDTEHESFRIHVTLGQTCGCGCKHPTNEGRSFVQGHDQRLIGILTRWAHTEISFEDGGMLVTTDARGYAARVFSPSGMDKLERSLARIKAAFVAPGVDAAPETPVPATDGVGGEVRAKIGRGVYSATIMSVDAAGAPSVLRYTVKSSGAKKDTTIFTLV